MKIQNSSFTIAGSHYAQIGKEANVSNNKIGNPNSANGVISAKSQFDKMIENIQEQIQKIQENDRYDADTKKSKIEELNKQIKEIEKARAEQLKESALGQTKKPDNKGSNNNTNNTKEKSNQDEVILDLSMNAKALLNSDNSLKNLKNAHEMKVKLEGEGNVLASEINIDKGRGVNTSKKEEQLAKIKKGVENSVENAGKAIKDINEAGNEISEGTQAVVSGKDSDSEMTDMDLKITHQAYDEHNRVGGYPLAE